MHRVPVPGVPRSTASGPSGGVPDVPLPEVPWWKDAVFYQVYPQSFADADGDGIGDLTGLCRRLDYLRWLGVDAVWLGPVYPSPMVDGGYDVSDHLGVNPLFGDLRTFDRLLAEVHRRGMRLIVDWVPNHTSDQHPWFVESRSSRDNPKRDWYFWLDGSAARPPNDWRAFGNGSAWTLDARTGQMYLHLFFPEQPDLNWNNPQVVAAMHATMRFWLDRGVDGFRVDVVHCIGKDPAHLRTAGTTLAARDEVRVHDEEGTHELIRGFRRIVDAYPGERLIVGEVILRQTTAIKRYYGQGDELHLAFNFLSLDTPWDARAWRELLDLVPLELGARDWPTWVLSNHDTGRHRSRYGGSGDRARAAAVLLLTLRGTPFVFQGEELGLRNAEVPPERRVDLLGRDGSRAPIPWSAAEDHGWCGAPPALPFPPESERHNVETLTADPRSILHVYRALLACRHASPALRRGGWRWLPTPAGVLGYHRSYEPTEHHRDERIVLVNFTDRPAAATVEGDWVVEVCSNSDLTGLPYPGELAPEHGVVLAPVPGTPRYWRAL